MNHPPPLRRRAAIGLTVGGLALVAPACPPPVNPPVPCTPTVLSEGHVDGPGFAYEDDAWNIHVHDEEADVEYEPGCVVLAAPAATEGTVPADPAFSFLGTAGDPIWVLPQGHVEGLLHLGYATEEIESGAFEGDSVDWSLVDVDGPGEFVVYAVDGFGVPTVVFDSSAALPQTVSIPTGAHVHVNWAFTAPGTYHVDYSVAGTPTGGSPVPSGAVEFTYEVGA